jgi:hypothetical protein
MTGKTQISIAAFVSEVERSAVRRAADHVARVLSDAGNAAWTCDCLFGNDMESLQKSRDVSIIVTSLLPELQKTDESWPQAKQRLRTAYASLGHGEIPVFICTILRHVSPDENPEAASALRLHIRRLNLLAAEISRETKAYVIDLDRVLADMGARRLQTNYRLTGNAATDMAGYFIALTLVNDALDALVSYEVQDAARTILTSLRPEIAESDNARPEITLWKNLQSMGQGRRKQTVSLVNHTVHENQAAWLVREALRGTIGPSEAFRLLAQAVRRRGVRESATLLASGLSKQINRKK